MLNRNVQPSLSLSRIDIWRVLMTDRMCEWCVHGADEICNGHKECTQMAQYKDAQTCLRLAYLCRESIRLPPSKASLQTRIIHIVQLTMRS